MDIITDTRTRCSQQKMSQFFFRFRREIARTKTQQITDKASKHNRRTVISWYLVLLMHASTGVVSDLSYIVYLLFVLLPHNFHQLPLFASSTLQRTPPLLRPVVSPLRPAPPSPRRLASLLQLCRICGNASLLHSDPPL